MPTEAMTNHMLSICSSRFRAMPASPKAPTKDRSAQPISPIIDSAIVPLPGRIPGLKFAPHPSKLAGLTCAVRGIRRSLSHTDSLTFRCCSIGESLMFQRRHRCRFLSVCLVIPPARMVATHGRMSDK